MSRTVTTVGEGFLETFYVETFGALFAVPDAAVEVYFYVGVVREEADGLLVPAPQTSVCVWEVGGGKRKEGHGYKHLSM